MRGRGVWLVLAAIAGALSSVGMAPCIARAEGPSEGRAISAIAGVPLRDADGRALRLGSRVTPGKPTLIAFWASWCGPCAAEAPGLAELRREFGGQAFNFLYINRRDGDPDPDQPTASITAFLARGGLADVRWLVADIAGYRRILGPDAATIPAGKVGIPRVYLFDARGREIYTAYGFDPANPRELRDRLTLALGK